MIAKKMERKIEYIDKNSGSVWKMTLKAHKYSFSSVFFRASSRYDELFFFSLQPSELFESGGGEPRDFPVWKLKNREVEMKMFWTNVKHPVVDF